MSQFNESEERRELRAGGDGGGRLVGGAVDREAARRHGCSPWPEPTL